MDILTTERLVFQDATYIAKPDAITGRIWLFHATHDPIATPFYDMATCLTAAERCETSANYLLAIGACELGTASGGHTVNEVQQAWRERLATLYRLRYQTCLNDEGNMGQPAHSGVPVDVIEQVACQMASEFFEVKTP